MKCEVCSTYFPVPVYHPNNRLCNKVEEQPRWDAAPCTGYDVCPLGLLREFYDRLTGQLVCVECPAEHNA